MKISSFFAAVALSVKNLKLLHRKFLLYHIIIILIIKLQIPEVVGQNFKTKNWSWKMV